MLFLTILLAGIAHGADFIDKPNHRWSNKKDPPEVVICDDAKVSEALIYEALKYWAQYDHVVTKVTRKKCLLALYSNQIRITGERDLDKSRFIGLTELYIVDDEISSASIKIDDEYANVKEVVVHEIGHSFGYGHSDDKNIMHRKYIKLGIKAE